MALEKRHYTDQETVITAKNLNDIQDAVIALEENSFSIDNEKSGEVITITDASNRGFRGLSIYGKTTQNGTPSPEAPVELVSVGNSGSIMVSVTGANTQRMTIETPNGLPGIPVAEGGNYTDANGQQWVCDEVDLARGVYVQRVKAVVCDGSEAWYEYVGSETYYGFYLSNVLDTKHQREIGLCNQFAVGFGSDSVWVGVGNTTLYVISKLWFDKGLSAWKDHIGAKPLRVIYRLTTPIETPLPEAETSAYKALQTYKNSTTVSNDASAHMKLEYAMDAKKYIDGLASGTIIPATVE